MTLHEFLSKSNRPTGVTLTISPYRPSASTLVLRPGQAPLYIYRVGPPTVGRFKSTRRLRWPIGRRSASVLGWVVTRKEMLAGPFIEFERPGQFDTLPTEERLKGVAPILMSSGWWDYRIHAPRQLRQGWAPSGERIL